ncbi:hypothetical protein PCC9214_04127 [Planktothrix tepida]|uniref:KGK family protein n=1 Tax=Planktothrix tepida PCC 9214 TaxID=671072 RepID=A0A1J1LPD6_9CYAN|nr:KGK domain-containing protein [Planktothrix tepida]CAD5975459.1 hypothetical protein PCC9214_04127 [Planktothrix tepida]CUR34279.1 conserved hypothetical protein [Planktothrix tepida PCC 9214]
MSELFVKLEQDDDIVMLGKDTFTVSRLKELVDENMKSKLFAYNNVIANTNFAVVDFLCRNLKITDKSIELNLEEFRLVFPLDGIDCQLLKLESRYWISGKIRFQVNADYKRDDLNTRKKIVNIELEFAPDEIISNETQEQKNANSNENLDEIRAKLNQINAL